MAVRLSPERLARPARPPMRPVRGEGVGARDRAVRRRGMWRGVVTVVVLAVVGLVHVWSRVALFHVRYDLAEVDQRQKELRKQVAQLEGRIGSLTSVDRLMSIATTQLGMTTPVPQQIVMVQSAEAQP